MADRGQHLVKGLGQRKLALLKAGGTVVDMAIAMQETNDMYAVYPDGSYPKDYPYGDKYPEDLRPKTEDAANFGIFKQGWFVLRSSVFRFRSLGPKDWNRGRLLNENLDVDVASLHESQNLLGWARWIAAHRGGQRGFDATWPKSDITNYQNGVFWIRDKINSNPEYKTDDTHFWVEVPPV
jgi:hypothetical protein